jgi:microsomal dipeptidase-like Zn-dependent dipeptidase
MPLFQRQDPRDIARMIKEVGTAHCTLSTDLGQIGHPPPVLGYKLFIANLLIAGINEEEIRLMAHKNQAELLSL